MAPLVPSVAEVALSTLVACHFAKSLEPLNATNAPKARAAAEEAGTAIVRALILVSLLFF